MTDAGRTIREEHREIREGLAQRVRAALERGTRDDLNALVALLEGDLLGHARAEQEHFYPAVDDLVRDHGRATATMAIDHEAIGKQVTLIAAAVERLRVARGRMERMEARTALREALLRIETLLAVHLEKEERVYLPLVEQHLAPGEQIALIDRMHGRGGPAPASDELDARRIPQRARHATIFATFDKLAVGGAFTLVSDHDPRPLSYQFAAEHPSSHAWEYVERGPVWRVRITRTAPG
jgi:uncharacterized protein (DUF2249 family)/iron-sulfur cluster repair protein YtfE (RIC family)